MTMTVANGTDVVDGTTAVETAAQTTVPETNAPQSLNQWAIAFCTKVREAFGLRQGAVLEDEDNGGLPYYAITAAEFYAQIQFDDLGRVNDVFFLPRKGRGKKIPAELAKAIAKSDTVFDAEASEHRGKEYVLRYRCCNGTGTLSLQAVLDRLQPYLPASFEVAFGFGPYRSRLWRRCLRAGLVRNKDLKLYVEV